MKECMDSENLHRRLKKIIGQINAIDRMIDEDIPCEQILMQVNASKSALHKVGHIIVEGHLEHCVKQAKLLVTFQQFWNIIPDFNFF